MKDLVLAPAGEALREELAEAPGWAAYEAALRGLLGDVLDAVDARSFEVGTLVLCGPLPEELSHLRNGYLASRQEAVDLVVRMVDGRGPSCTLSVPGLVVFEPGWDGAIHVSAVDEPADRLRAGAGSLVAVEPGTPYGISDHDKPVERPADATFWDSVRQAVATAAPASVSLLRERWAHGEHGSTWYRLDGRNVDGIAAGMAPRSLLTFIPDAPLRDVHSEGPEEIHADLRDRLLDDDFNAFREPMPPGQLVYRSREGGTEDPQELLREGYTRVLLGEDVPRAGGVVSVVVPDADGVIRQEWEDDLTA